jgi:hypothetical protein
VTGATAVWPVAVISRMVFPQTSAHGALKSLRKKREVGQLEKVPAPSAAELSDDYPLAASEVLQGKFAVVHAGESSQVRCSWGRISVRCDGGNTMCCPRKTDEG